MILKCCVPYLCTWSGIVFLRAFWWHPSQGGCSACGEEGVDGRRIRTVFCQTLVVGKGLRQSDHVYMWHGYYKLFMLGGRGWGAQQNALTPSLAQDYT